MAEDITSIRVEYGDDEFGPAAAGSDPMALFDTWFEAARALGEREPNAMTLATVGRGGAPSARVVLLKAVDPAAAAFTWYTNLDSRKARELREGGGLGALCWWWPVAGGRQVRAAGRVEEVSREDAAAYFASRPAAARVGASVSEQSRAISARDELVDAAARLDAATVPLPDRWGGLRLVADELEFWQGRAGRLHDRITFLRTDAHGEPLPSAAVEAAGGRERLAELGDLVRDQHGTSWLRARLAP